MQRLFSMFPTGWPGVALLLLRVALAATLLHGVLSLPVNLDSPWILFALSATAIALCVGYLTPVAAAVSVVMELAAWPLGPGAVAAMHVCAILVALALAMLGPGAYSMDARLFGRRRVIFSSRDDTEDE